MRKLFTAITILTLTLPLFAQAQQLLLPAVFEVTGVADDDTLNIRSKPDGTSTDIGDLHPYEMVEVIAYDASEKWARIIWEEGDGWISRQYLTAFEEQDQIDKLLDVTNFSCSGTEPFWSVYIPAGIDEYTFGILNTSDQEAYDWLEYESRVASLNAPNSYFAFQGQSSTDDESLYTAILKRAECSDGMSDRNYGWSLDLLEYYRGRLEVTKSGCCTMESTSDDQGDY